MLRPQVVVLTFLSGIFPLVPRRFVTSCFVGLVMSDETTRTRAQQGAVAHKVPRCSADGSTLHTAGLSWRALKANKWRKPPVSALSLFL